MKVWTRQPDGSYQVRGEVTTRRVRLVMIKPYGKDYDYKPVHPIYLRQRAEQIIEDAIARGRARAEAYQLEPIEDAKPDEAAQARFTALRAAQKGKQWREPAKTRSEAARRAWETRRKEGRK